MNNFCLIALFIVVQLNFSAFAMDLACASKPDEIERMKNQLLNIEKMVPVTSHFTNVGTNQKANWGMATLMMNLETKKGYQWAKWKIDDIEVVCIAKKYSRIDLFLNNRLDARAFLDKKYFPKANDRGDGKDFSTLGANGILLVKEKRERFPMYRAYVDDIVAVSSEKPTPRQYIEFLVSNPSSKDGEIFGVTLQGNGIAEYTSVLGRPAIDGVRYGAIYSPAGEEYLKKIAR
ncbi:MAG TPA: hypothetical protein VM512_09395 [Burkholderiaceae bacterium]|jgi:hypothetical protein|nr:hypothetical protein [Burkholderiaceae bacterium]